ncbi:MAG: class I SAM-dependent methyltransferase [archaeon]
MGNITNGAYGEKVWNDKIKAQGEVGVIFGTVSSMKKVNEETKKFMNFFDEQISPRLEKGAKILDLGTGPMARFSIALANRGYKVIGIDISEETLRLAKKYAENQKAKVDFKKADMTEIDKIDQKFDFAMCIATFYHVPPHLTGIALMKINKVLNKDGKFLVEFGVHTKKTFKTFIKDKIYWAGHYAKRLFGKGFNVNVSRFSQKELTELIEKTGFTIEKKFGPAMFLLRVK